MAQLHSSPRRMIAAARRVEPAPAPQGRRDRLFHPFAGDVPVVLVPERNDSGPRHWQTVWQQIHPGFHRVTLADGPTPDLERWASAVSMVLRSLPIPPIVVAHGFGCLATVRSALRDRLPLAAAMLVAPADPERFDAKASPPPERLAYPALVVASTNDPRLRFTRAGVLAHRWGARLVACSDAGHLNGDSGLDAWAAGLALLRELAERAAAVGSIVPASAQHRPAARPRGCGTATSTRTRASVDACLS